MKVEFFPDSKCHAKFRDLFNPPYLHQYSCLSMMDILKHACFVLSTVAGAIQICRKGENSSREWKSDLRFCSTLQSTLEDIVAWQPGDENFTHDHELDLL